MLVRTCPYPLVVLSLHASLFAADAAHITVTCSFFLYYLSYDAFSVPAPTVLSLVSYFRHIGLCRSLLLMAVTALFDHATSKPECSIDTVVSIGKF